MRALVMEGFGPAAEARIGDMPMPVAGPNDIIIRMVAAGVNPTDYKEIQGYLTGFYPPYSGPWIPGHDGAGLVEHVGSDVEGFVPGDPVMFVSNRAPGLQSGTFAEFAVVSSGFVAKAPRSISLLEASTIPVAAATSHQGLFLKDAGGAQRGQKVLIHGAAGGLGSFAVGLARAAGLQIAATCRQANASYVEALGAHHAIDYQTNDIAVATKAWSSSGVDVVLDCVSGGHDQTLLNVLNSGGRLIVISTADHDADIQALQDEASKRAITATLFVLNLSVLTQTLEDIGCSVDEGRLIMPRVTSYPLEEAARALAAMETGGICGKLAIEIGKR